jgi:hypothetical protein
MPKRSKKRVESLARHRRLCTVCKHPQCAEIEADFVAWRGPIAITEDYGLGNRAAVYRHAHAFGLYDKRRANIRAALEHIIEKASEVEVTAPAVVAAIQAYAKINSRGQWIERTQTVDLNKLFAEMTAAELEAYAQKGILPGWFEDTISSQQADAIGGSDDQVE